MLQVEILSEVLSTFPEMLFLSQEWQTMLNQSLSNRAPPTQERVTHVNVVIPSGRWLTAIFSEECIIFHRDAYNRLHISS